jgi:hypothetical protein
VWSGSSACAMAMRSRSSRCAWVHDSPLDGGDASGDAMQFLYVQRTRLGLLTTAWCCTCADMYMKCSSCGKRHVRVALEAGG